MPLLDFALPKLQNPPSEGFELLPPEEFVQMIGVEMLYNKGRTDKAMECFQMNVANYPNSFDYVVKN